MMKAYDILENMKECAVRCVDLDTSCPCDDCRMWIDHEEDLNCTNVAIAMHGGSMTLREIAPRIGRTFVRVKQIETDALRKLHQKID
tara:strand:- start:2617 stop:2877 length:261 start_codon:yes stop_codon:yes gene_type:complete